MPKFYLNGQENEEQNFARPFGPFDFNRFNSVDAGITRNGPMGQEPLTKDEKAKKKKEKNDRTKSRKEGKGLQKGLPK